MRAAMAQSPASKALTQRFAALLVANYCWDEAIPLLETIIEDDPGFVWYEALSLSHLAQKKVADTKQAQYAARRACDVALTPEQRGRGLALLGKTHIRLHDNVSAEATLIDALVADPQHKDAYKRLTELYLKQNRPGDVLALADRLAALGVCHARLLASRTLAYAQRGDEAAAQATIDLPRFVERLMLPPPAGWTDIATFNEGLRDEILSLTTQHDNCDGSAARQARRIDEPENSEGTLVAILEQCVAQAVAAYVASIDGIDHPWVHAKPARGRLHSWVVMTEGKGFEDWHAHQYGWLSGAYYVAVPERSVRGDDAAGCIAFGLPGDHIGADGAARFGQQIERIESGLLLLFPSHAFHRTFVCPSPELRMCFAFDVWPA